MEIYMFESILNWLLDQLQYLLIYGATGLIIGWNVLPQPQFMKRLYDKFFNKEDEKKKG